MEFVVITGMSGAGKSCVVNALEDIGFFCVDNLPAELIPVFAKLLQKSPEHKKVAVVTDVRAGQSFTELFSSLDTLRELQIPYKLMFLDADDPVLIKRYKETRRKHPLQSDSGSVQSALTKERKLLAEARSHADYFLDTSNLSATQCRIRVLSMFSDVGEKQTHIHFMSFGYKHGIPNDADYVFDVRSLPNIRGNTQFSFVDLIAELAKNEGRSQLVVAVGCTGGHHRSVTFAELLYAHLKDRISASVSHRDILK